MYERSASVLEKHLSKTLLYISELKENYDYYKELIELLENYQNASEKEITYEKEYEQTKSVNISIGNDNRSITFSV